MCVAKKTTTFLARSAQIRTFVYENENLPRGVENAIIVRSIDLLFREAGLDTQAVCCTFRDAVLLAGEYLEDRGNVRADACVRLPGNLRDLGRAFCVASRVKLGVSRSASAEFRRESYIRSTDTPGKTG